MGVRFGHSVCPHGAGAEEKALTGTCVIHTPVEPSQAWVILPGPGESLLASLRLEAGRTGGNEHTASAAVYCESTQTDSCALLIGVPAKFRVTPNPTNSCCKHGPFPSQGTE